MRTYYIFNINKEMSILTKDSPYMLFKSLESIYKANRSDLYMASSLYEQLACKFNKEALNKKILDANHQNQHYIFVNNEHKYFNKYRDESCNLKVKNSYMIYNSNCSKMELLHNLKTYNLFACDFENKDYFWLDEIYC